MKEINRPEARRGLSRLLNMLKALGTIPGEENQ
jgi:hypothetical protein